MIDKKCACRGISLLRDMADALQLWADNNKSYKTEMARIGPAMYYHLVEQAAKPGNEELAKKAEPLLAKQKIELDLLQGKNPPDPMHLYEQIRNDIHQNTFMKPLVYCGYGKSDEYDEAAMAFISRALEVMAGNTGEDPFTAKLPLFELQRLITCD